MLVWNGESPTFRLQHEILRYLWRAERAAKFLTVAGWVLGLGPAGDAGSWVLGLPGRLGLGSWGQGPRPVSGVKYIRLYGVYARLRIQLRISGRRAAPPPAGVWCSAPRVARLGLA